MLNLAMKYFVAIYIYVYIYIYIYLNTLEIESGFGMFFRWNLEGFQRLSKRPSIGLVGFPWKFMAELIQSHVYRARRCFDLT